MGVYLNPGNSGFSLILNDEYVDKTGLIELINNSINSPRMLSCISRPRRFGKSYAAKMLCAYYDCSCDSRTLFDDKEIAHTEGYLTHLNQYHVVNLDITSFISAARRQQIPIADVPNIMVESVHKELKDIVPDLPNDRTLAEDMITCVEKTGRKFIFIIDEWDALIREAKNDTETQMIYLNLLREWFKNNNITSRVVAAAYMTGILPIKKDGSQSAISDFREYTILNPGRFTEYTGFTEKEVRSLCKRHDMDYSDIKTWYDGYDFPKYGAIYNPYSVMCAIQDQKCCSYWQKTSAAESLMTYINMDFEGLQEIIARLISGEEIEVRTTMFENDFETFRSKDDVLTLLMHLGYLAYHEETGMVRIPNEEVRQEFEKILDGTGASQKWVELITNSRELISNTIAGNETAVACAIQKIRDTQYAPTFYNNEQALRYVIKFAYIAAMEEYLKIEELPSGHGIADVVYLPKRMSRNPVLLIELKWNRSAEGAIHQVKEKNYPAILKNYGGDILLVGINYDEKTKEHQCVIEKIRL